MPDMVSDNRNRKALPEADEAKTTTAMIFPFVRYSAVLAPRFALLLTAAGLTLSACSEPEIVLPGKREPVASVLQVTGPVADDVDLLAADVATAFSAPPTVANVDWTHGIGTPDYRTLHPALGASLTRVWSVNIGAGDGRKQRITADPVVADGRIYTMDSGSRVTAVSTSGATLWSTDIRPDRDSDGDATGGGLAYEGGTLYVASGYGTLTALDAASGAERWVQQLDATASGRPTVFGNLVYVVAGDDTGWAVERDSGRIAWQVGAAASTGNVLGAPAPVVDGDIVVFAFGSGELQAVFRRGGLRRWDATVLGERPGRALSKVDDVTGTPVMADGIVYAGSQAGRTVALSQSGGARLWTAQEGALDAVLPVGGSVFQVSDRNELLRLDAATGARIWGTELPNFVKDRPRRISEVFAHHGPILAGGRLIVASNDGLLRSFDPETGALQATVEVPGGATTAPVVAGGTLYVVSTNGQLHAFR